MSIARSLSILLSVATSVPLGLPGPAAAGEVPASGEIPLEQFVRNAEFNHIEISPNGDFLAATVPLPGGNVVLVVIDRASMKLLHTMEARGDEQVHRFWWVNDRRVVVSVAQKFGGFDTPVPTGTLYAVDADGKNNTMLFGYRAGDELGSHIHRASKQRAYGELVDTLPDNDKEIVVAAYNFDAPEGAVPDLFRINVYTGERVPIGRGPALRAEVRADHKGVVRLASAEQSDQSLRLYYREGANADWQVANDSAKSGLELTPLGFASDDRSYFVRATEPDGPDAIYRIDIASGQRQQVFRDALASPSLVLQSEISNQPYGVVTTVGESRVAMFDPDARESRYTAAMAKSFPGQLAYFTSFTRDGKFGLLLVESDRNPGDFYLFDLEAKKASYVASRRRWLDPERMGERRPFELDASDGVKLHGYLTLPQGREPKRLPLVVLPHGGPHGIYDDWRFDEEAQLLASRGYAVLQLNFRGSGGYGRRFIESGYRQWGARMQQDLSEATRAAIERGFADQKRVCIYGASYGGYAALMGAVRDPDLYRCAIGYAGVYDLRMMYQRGDIQQTLFGERYLALAIGSDANELAQRSPVAQVEKIKAAIMLIHGGQDRRVPIAHANAMRKALDGRHYKYEWFTEATEGHGFYREDHRIELYQRMLAFLDAQIGAKAAVAAAE